MASTSECPIARNFSGGMSAGATRFIADVDSVTADFRATEFPAAGFLAGLRPRFLFRVWDFGNVRLESGCAQNISEIGLFCAKDSSAMKPTRRPYIAGCLCTALVVLAACHSFRGSEEPATRPGVYIPRAASHEEELSLIRADSEVFAAVVRAQLGAGDDEYPYHIEELRYDPRPYGTRNGYPDIGAGVQGAAPELYFARAGQDAIDQIAENRKLILQQRNVPEGSPFNYPQCAGVKVPKPPPSRRGSTRARPVDVHAG